MYFYVHKSIKYTYALLDDALSVYKMYSIMHYYFGLNIFQLIEHLKTQVLGYLLVEHFNLEGLHQ